MSVCDQFYSKNRDLSKSDHVCGSESCHEQRRLLRTSEKELMLLIRLEKLTKPSLKSLDLSKIHNQTDCVQMEEIKDPCYLPGEWSTNKDHSKAERVIVCEVAKVPRVTSKQLNDISHWLMLMFMSPASGEHRAARRKPLFSKKKIAY